MFRVREWLACKSNEGIRKRDREFARVVEVTKFAGGVFVRKDECTYMLTDIKKKKNPKGVKLDARALDPETRRSCLLGLSAFVSFLQLDTSHCSTVNSCRVEKKK